MINIEYQKYRQAGGVETEEQYGIRLERLRSDVGRHIVNNWDISRRVYKRLDLNSAFALSQVSSKMYKKANTWFASQARDIVLRYVANRETSYKDYLKAGGWQDVLISGAQATGFGITVGLGIKSAIHASRIPPNAPKDHPEAKKAAICAISSMTLGVVTLSATAYRIASMLDKISIHLFFSAVEEDIIGAKTTPLALKILSPNFHNWKLSKMKQNLISNPPNWQENENLKKMVCPLSEDFMMFPVKDKCGHLFDYRSVIAYQLDPNTSKPLECPISCKKPNNGLLILSFDMEKFRYIQSHIHN